MDDDDESSVSPGIFLPQPQDEGEPAFENDPSDLDDSVSVDQPGSTVESPFFVDDDEEEVSAEPEGSEEPETPEDEPSPGPGDDVHGNGNGEMESEDSISDDGVGCTRECQEQSRGQNREIERLERRLVMKDTEIARLREQLELMEAELSELRPREPRQTPSWQEMLRGCLAGDGSFTYNTAWRQSYRALNIPMNLEMCHPQIRFRQAQNEDDDENGSSRQVSPSDASVRSDEEIRAVIPLPDDIIFRILKELLSFPEALIHCISRLDPFQMPAEFPSVQELGNACTGIQNRFFFARDRRSYLSLTHDTEDPQTVLAAACVSKKFNWYCCHIFYGSNTFGMSIVF